VDKPRVSKPGPGWPFPSPPSHRLTAGSFLFSHSFAELLLARAADPRDLGRCHRLLLRRLPPATRAAAEHLHVARPAPSQALPAPTARPLPKPGRFRPIFFRCGCGTELLSVPFARWYIRTSRLRAGNFRYQYRASPFDVCLIFPLACWDMPPICVLLGSRSCAGTSRFSPGTVPLHDRFTIGYWCIPSHAGWGYFRRRTGTRSDVTSSLATICHRPHTPDIFPCHARGSLPGVKFPAKPSRSQTTHALPFTH